MSAAAGVILSLVGVTLALRSALLLGVLLLLAGVAVATGSAGLSVAAAVAGVAAHVWVVRFEEPHLQARFGEAYREYLARVPRWVPHVVRRPDEDVR